MEHYLLSVINLLSDCMCVSVCYVWKCYRSTYNNGRCFLEYKTNRTKHQPET